MTMDRVLLNETSSQDYESMMNLSFSYESVVFNSVYPSVTKGDKGLCSAFGFQFYMNAVVITILSVFGLTGNTISILVLQKDKYNRVAVFLLQCLAIADNAVLIMSFIILSLAYGILPVVDYHTWNNFRPYVVKYLNPVGIIANCTVVWITVLLAVNRYIAICRPFSAKKLLTMACARIQVAVVVVVSVSLNLPRIFIYDNNLTCIKTNGNLCNESKAELMFNRSSLGYDTLFRKVYFDGFYSAVALILPVLLLIGFNVPIIRQMQKSKHRMKRNSLSYKGRQEDSITMVMVVIIIQLIICHLPDRFAQFYRWMPPSAPVRCPDFIFFFVNITNTLIIFNTSTDFIVYYVFRKRFRRILCEKLFCRRRNGSNLSPVQSENISYNLNSRYCTNSIRKDSRRRMTDEGNGLMLSISDRYKLSKKRDSNAMLLLKVNNNGCT